MCQPELVAESGWFRSVRLKKKVGRQAFCMPAARHMCALIAGYISDVSLHILLFQWFYSIHSKV